MRRFQRHYLAPLLLGWTCLAQKECYEYHTGNTTGDFITEPLKVGKVTPIRWKDTGKIAHEYAFQVGIGDEMRKKLLDFCNYKGITEMLEHVTAGGNGLEPSGEFKVFVEDDSYVLQRPSYNWNSDLHWLTIYDDELHDEWMEALSAVGFDEVLKGIGESLGLDGLFAFSSTFVAASIGGKGFLHDDVANTDGKTYNIIIPLLSTANETQPQFLDIQDSTRTVEGSNELMVGRYEYQPDVAVLVGDSVKHATSALDYRENNGFRMAATILVTDANSDNIDRVADNESGHYAAIDAGWILENAGSHWKAGDPSKTLPKPRENHFLANKATSSS